MTRNSFIKTVMFFGIWVSCSAFSWNVNNESPATKVLQQMVVEAQARLNNEKVRQETNYQQTQQLLIQQQAALPTPQVEVKVQPVIQPIQPVNSVQTMYMQMLNKAKMVTCHTYSSGTTICY